MQQSRPCGHESGTRLPPPALHSLKAVLMSSAAARLFSSVTRAPGVRSITVYILNTPCVGGGSI